MSDHLPLKCLVHVNLSRATQRQASTDKPQRIRWEKVNKEDYKRRVTEELHSIQDATNSLSTMDIKVSKINEILVKSAKDLQPTRLKPKRKPKLAVWTQDIKQALSEKKKAFFNWKKENRPTAKDNALVINKKQSTQKLRKMCRMESARQREARRQEILDAKYEDSGLFHRLIRKQRGRLRQCVNELHVNGNIYHTEIDIMQGFREHFQSLAASSEVPGMDKRYCDTVSGEVTEIIDLCSSANYRHPDPLSMDQVKKAIESLNKGKAADFYGVTAEHFIYGGEELLRTTTDILNNLYKFGQLTDSMKTGVLTPVFKKKGSSNDVKNYRGITILPTLTKILETVLKETVRPAVERCQNKLQRGFTQNSSPMNCSLILEEVIREAKDLKEPLYIAFLDVKAAFDVVSHASLLRKLFHIGIEGPEWSLIHSMHVGAESVVKWEGATSDPFQVQQGVRQGGILSTDLYKLYGNRLLNRLTDLAIGAHIGETSCVAPTTADDMALVASELTVLQRLVNTSVDYSLMENYLLQPVKSVIVSLPNKGKKRQSPVDIDIHMNGVRMPVVQEAAHMGIIRSADSQESTVKQNIEKARRTIYCLMGAGLHGENGLDPDSSIHILQTYVLPLLVYGLEVLLPRKTLLDKLERAYKKFLKQILSLPNSTADPAIYILSGTIPIEGVIHKRALTLIGNISRLPDDSVEKKIAVRQLSVKGENSHSWFIDVKHILIKYGLPSPWEIMESTPTKFSWKRQVKKQVDAYWVDALVSKAALYPSLEYRKTDSYVPGKKHPVIQEAHGVKDISRIHTKVRVLTGVYVLQVNRAAFNQNGVNPTCLLCKEDDETTEHFILQCPALNHVRQPILEDIHVLHICQS
ncbi:MAG: reverse transcriptase domain-containing protein, partial [Candidatus Thiodiazotropha endolucinida]|nr:hypothetical protein [Candidatus Thiodiazotropha taylori]MCW4345455.1 reverse transcriptase domain-containing protein [Candidatus Thiodiazotropha endolucinida]